MEKHCAMKDMRTIALALSLFAGLPLSAQLNPVSWTFESRALGEGEYELVMTADLDPGWNIYSQYLESDDGPVRTSFYFELPDGVELLGKTSEEGHRKEGYDSLFDMNVVKFSGRVVFRQRVKAPAGGHIQGAVEYMTCDDERCLPPREVPFSIALQ
ncbi:MAG: hypothetical protein D6765_06545 [Bacteroidetes bacterium]|nr:MAG: hypothetical protein D6765_06545 [Bacteroidota bacterium]